MSKEEYLIKKQQKEQEYSRKLLQKKIKKVLVVLVPILLIAGGLFIWINNYYNSPKSQTGAPRVEISPKEYDVGNISINGGLIKKDYEIKNTGNGDLKITDIWTSCHCTTAILKVGDKESPKFGMDHAGFWSQILAPGQTAQLKVIFDPAFHGPQGVGPAVREIYLSTNDSKNKTASVMLTANVTSQ